MAKTKAEPTPMDALLAMSDSEFWTVYSIASANYSLHTTALQERKRLAVIAAEEAKEAARVARMEKAQRKAQGD